MNSTISSSLLMIIAIAICSEENSTIAQQISRFNIENSSTSIVQLIASESRQKDKPEEDDPIVPPY